MPDHSSHGRPRPNGPVAGRQLGGYQVQSLLGVGGMGEVYRARDTKLERDVAIKVLPPSFADDTERLHRFEREARMLAALNHPHIGAIYGLEDVDSIRFLVLELVDGETLAERIARAAPAIALDEALAIALQLTDALDAAHEKGIVHRDLKPGNIKITADGVVKVLDFGLAKIDSPESDANPSHSPTVTVHGTRAGVILGTAAYMSPEQTRGRPVDKRTDVWAFGCVLYEMLAGRAAFAGETVSDIIAAILGREPDWSALPATTPVGVRRLLHRCLAKDPKRRLRDIADARLEIETLVGEPIESAGANNANVSTRRQASRLRASIGVLSLLLLASLAAVVVLLRRPAPASNPEPVRRFSMELGYVRPVISPDGRHIAYRTNDGLWIRDVDSEAPREIPGARRAGGYYSDQSYYLTWSPDSRDIAFLADNELRRVSVAQGGATTTICALPPGRPGGRQVGGVAWSSDGQTIVFSRYGAGIFEVSSRAGSPTLLWKENHADDLLLFDTAQGRAVVFAEESDRHNLVVRTASGERRVLVPLESSWPELVYSPSGHVLYRHDPVESSSIWAMPFSAETLAVVGKPFPVERAGQGMSLSADGALVYLEPGRIRSQRLAWRDRAGKLLEQSTHAHDSIEALSLSPNGDRAVVATNDGGHQGFWMYDVQRFSRSRLEFGADVDGARRLAALFVRPDEIFYTLQTSPSETTVFAVSADNPVQGRPVPAPDGFKIGLGRTADGRFTLLAGDPKGTGVVNLWLMRKDRSNEKGEAVHFSQNSEREFVAALSPNARYVAYTSTIGGQLDVFVRPFPEGKGRWQISSAGGQGPIWGADGRELFFVEANALKRVAVSTTGEFSAGAAESLFEHPTLRVATVPAARFGVSRDGRRILTVETERDRTVPVVHYVQNWLSGFNRAPQGSGAPAR